MKFINKVFNGEIIYKAKEVINGYLIIESEIVVKNEYILNVEIDREKVKNRLEKLLNNLNTIYSLVDNDKLTYSIKGDGSVNYWLEEVDKKIKDLSNVDNFEDVLLNGYNVEMKLELINEIKNPNIVQLIKLSDLTYTMDDKGNLFILKRRPLVKDVVSYMNREDYVVIDEKCYINDIEKQFMGNISDQKPNILYLDYRFCFRILNSNN